MTKYARKFQFQMEVVTLSLLQMTTGMNSSGFIWTGFSTGWSKTGSGLSTWDSTQSAPQMLSSCSGEDQSQDNKYLFYESQAVKYWGADK